MRIAILSTTIVLLLFCCIIVFSLYQIELGQYLPSSSSTIVTKNKEVAVPPSWAYSVFDDVESTRIKEEERSLSSSPACKPHFQLVLPNGNWTNENSTTKKFKRLYFYHSRKAGVREVDGQLQNALRYVMFVCYNL